MDDALEITEQVVTGGLNQAQKNLINGFFMSLVQFFGKKWSTRLMGRMNRTMKKKSFPMVTPS